jgi:hypothetical protein
MSSGIILFPEKEAKSVVLLCRRLLSTHNSAKPTLGVWGLAPKEPINKRNHSESTLFSWPTRVGETFGTSSDLFAVDVSLLDDLLFIKGC